MFRNYLKTGWRRLIKNKLYTGVNLLGLTVGMTCCLLIGLFIAHELNYDRFNQNADRIVRVTMDYGDGGSTEKMAVTGTKVGPQFDRTFSQIEAFTRVYNQKNVVQYQDKMFDEKRILFADSSFLKIFSFALLRGDPKNILVAPGAVILTKSTARKYFGSADPIGKTLRIGADRNYTITGIVADPPDASQIKFDFIVSFTSLDQAKQEQWWTANYLTYLLLHDRTQIASLQQQITAYMKSVCKNELQMTGQDYLTYHLEPLNSVHLYSPLSGLEPNGNITTVYILGIIGVLIMIIACINYTNLASAQATDRSTEIGLRKVFGAGRRQLFTQFISESLILTLIALILAWALAVFLLPAFNRLSGQSFTAHMMTNPLFILTLLLLCMLITLASGSYPSIILSNARLVNILKSGLRLSSSGGSFRNSLIIFQFVISVGLIISTLVIVQQLTYIRHKDLGYSKEHIIVLPIDNRIRKNYDAFKNALGTYPQVLSVSGAYESPTLIQWGDEISADNGLGEVHLNVNAIPVDLGFVHTMGMQVLAGTDFTPADLQQMDTSNNNKNFHYSFMLNETAVRLLGWTPAQAIGRTITKGADGIVKAVIKDFNFNSLHQAIGPLVVFLDKEYINEMFIKVKGNNIPATLQFLKGIWKERVPYRPFEYRFLNDDYNSLYINEQRIAKVLAVFSALAILLACLGLLTMAAYTAARRSKEIGIRRVLGATSINITSLISKDFLKLVMIGILIAFPIAWWTMNRWLQNFAYRIHIHWWTFLLAGLLVIIITLMTVSFQAIKAAMANPAKTLRTE